MGWTDDRPLAGRARPPLDALPTGCPPTRRFPVRSSRAGDVRTSSTSFRQAYWTGCPAVRRARPGTAATNSPGRREAGTRAGLLPACGPTAHPKAVRKWPYGWRRWPAATLNRVSSPPAAPTAVRAPGSWQRLILQTRVGSRASQGAIFFFVPAHRLHGRHGARCPLPGCPQSSRTRAAGAVRRTRVPNTNY